MRILLLIIGILCLVVSITGLILYKPKQLVYHPPVQSTPEPAFTPSPVQQTLTRTPTLEPSATPTPEPLPPFSIKQIGQNEWRVIVPAGQWYDTGIPVIADTTLVIQRADGGKWILKLGGKLHWPGYSVGGPVLLNNFSIGDTSHYNFVVDPDFQDTVKLKVDDEGQKPWVTVSIQVSGWGSCGNQDPFHLALHNKAKAWFQTQKATVERQ